MKPQKVFQLGQIIHKKILPNFKNWRGDPNRLEDKKDTKKDKSNDKDNGNGNRVVNIQIGDKIGTYGKDL